MTRDSVERQKYMSDQPVEVYLFVITMNRDSPEDMYSPLVRCTLKVRRQLLCNFLPGKSFMMNTEFLKVRRGAV